jgi:crotonobetainyl-CoA:carnitine CoA-transferase CaiB-like acyl-CoA transferase
MTRARSAAAKSDVRASAGASLGAPGDDGILGPYRVLDLTDERGFLCGRILGDLGADVIKIEPPGGDRARRIGPFAGGDPDPERSLYWWAYNCSKRGVTLALNTPTGRSLFQRLVCGADFVIESFDPGTLDAWGVGPEWMRALNPGVIVTSISPYGQTGPRAQAPASDLEVMAASGFLGVTGEPGREPVRITLAQTPMWAGLHAAMGALIALHARRRLGTGQHVDVSAQASVIAAIGHAPAFTALGAETPSRSGAYVTGRSVTGARMRTIWPCRDGYVTFAIYGGAPGRRTMAALLDWMRELGHPPGALAERDWSTFDIATLTQAEIDALEAPIAAFFPRLTKHEYYAGVLERAMLGYPVATAADTLADPHLAARAAWTPIEIDPQVAGSALEGAVVLPEAFAPFFAAEARIRCRAPRIGEHNRAIYGGELGLDAETLGSLMESGVI